MVFSIGTALNGTYTDLLQYWAYGLQAQTTDVQGPNQGTNILGHEIVDKVAEKRTIDFQSIPITIAQARTIRAIVSKAKFYCKSDLWTGSTETFVVKATGRVLGITRHNKKTNVTTVTLKFTIEEIG